MNKNYSVNLSATVTYRSLSIEFTFDPYNDSIKDDDALMELAREKLDEEFDGWNVDGNVNDKEIEIEITYWDDLPDGHDGDIESAYAFCEAWAECEQESEVVVAALSAGIEPDDIDEAYCGEFKDDEEFAQDTAEQTGAIDNDAKWPMNCIDWEQAAKELMQDYHEEDGYYFRAM